MTYQLVNSILERLDADMAAAEAQGIATGMLCVEGRADVGNWLRELVANEWDIDTEDKAGLVELFEQTRSALHSDDEFGFDLLVADDDEPLYEQAEALRCWCQGFLFGVGYGQSTVAEWPGDIDEVMRDMIEFTKIDSDVGGEDDENALVEIREYVRVAVLSVRDQFAESNQSPSH